MLLCLYLVYYIHLFEIKGKVVLYLLLKFYIMNHISRYIFKDYDYYLLYSFSNTYSNSVYNMRYLLKKFFCINIDI